MSPTLERLIKTRETLRSLVKTLLDNIEKDYQAKPDNLELLREYLVQLKLKEEKLYNLDAEIEFLIELSELAKEILAVEEFKERIALWKNRIERRLQTKDDGKRRSQGSSGTIGNMNIQLPRLVLSKFNGDVSRWQSFWSQFEAAIDKNEALTDVDKFNYLKSFLEGSAASAISGLPLTEANYQVAVDLLKNRFGRRDLLISTHMNNLLNIAPVKRCNDVAALRQLYDVCEVHIRSLETMGVASNTYGALLCPVLLKRIPPELALDYTKTKKGSADWDVSHLMAFLRVEIENREQANFIIGANDNSFGKENCKKSDHAESEKQSKQKQKSLPSTATFNASVETKCIFCNDAGHMTDKCIKSLEEKRNELMSQKRCFVCLKQYHIGRFCRSKKRCGNCHKRHHYTLCNASENINTNQDAAQSDAAQSAVIASVTDNNKASNCIYLQTTPALVKGVKNEAKVRILYDSGSQRSFICESLSRRLNLKILGTEEITIHTFGQNKPRKISGRRVKVPLQNINSEEIVYIEALETPAISSALVQVPTATLLSKLNDLQISEIDIAETAENIGDRLSILIGSDFYWELVTGKIKRLDDSLVALETKLGWSLHGPSPVSSSTTFCGQVNVLKIMIDQTEEKLVSTQLKQFWEIESMGIVENLNESEPDQIALKLFEDNVQLNNGRYSVKLPWKPDMKDQLPDNYALAESRLRGTLRRLQQNPVLFAQYDDIFKDYLNKGIIEEIDNSQPATVKHYLPHRAVIKPDRSTTRVRIVFDASARMENQVSLNDCLYSGPNLNPDLLTLLLKFRQNQIAFTSDIEKAFLQIEVSPEDRDVTRFLWIDDTLKCTDDMKLKIFRLTRVTFGVTSSPFLLSAVVKHHLVKYESTHPESYQLMSESLYVDDLVGGADSVDQALQRSVECTEIMQEAGMPFMKWQTNSLELKERWKSININMDEKGGQLLEPNVSPVKVLGLAWQPESDSFYFDVSELLKFLLNRRDTKRFLLQASGRIFDPLGLLTPYTIRVKCIFQELWVVGIGWDDPLPIEIQKKWTDWCSELTEIRNLNIPRCCFADCDENQGIQLHCFCDASEKAYAAALYLRYSTKGGNITVILICAKARVAPLKKLTVARLELMAALLGTRLASTATKSLKTKVTNFFWTDSKIVYFWITGDPRRFKPFVQNRLSEIQTLTNPENWSHCPGRLNPADLSSRGKNLSELENSSFWWQGPDWLMQSEEYWPKEKTRPKPNDESEIEEIRNSCNNQVHLIINVTPIIELDKFSSLWKLLRITAWIYSFIFNMHPTRKEKRSGDLTSEEIQRAEIYWARTAQILNFDHDIQCLKSGNSLDKNSKIANLNPFLDQKGLLRVGGRIQHSELSFSQKHPVILPETSKFTELVIQATHKRIMHCGLASTLAQVRQNYWILRGRQVIKRVIRRCLVCHKYRAKPVTEDMAPLPKERMTETPCFAVSGLDYCGPLLTKTDGGTEKSYVALFTCAVTRALHLELVSDLSADKFLLALRRFLARRGTCSVIYSDNATTFKRAEKEIQALQKLTKEEKIQDFLSQEGIQWKYIVPRAPWTGGFWERLIRSIKACLRKTLGKALLTFEEMATLLTELEAILNSRPISYIYNDASEPEPVTPSLFLTGRDTLLGPPKGIPPVPETASQEGLTKRKKFRQLLLKKIWTKWRQQYLQDLRSAHTNITTKDGPSIKKDDVVLLNDEKRPRVLWKLGIVTDVFPGRDGKVRSCTVRLANGTQLRRPVQLLSPLELHC